MTTATRALTTDEPDVRAEDLVLLGNALRRSGLGAYVGCFDPLRPRQGDWARHRDRAPERLRPLIDFCLLNRAVAPDALPRDVRDQLGIGEGLGLVGCDGSRVMLLGGLAIVPVFGRWLLCHAPRAGQHFYFGDDTVALLSRMIPQSGGRCLDVCSGPGTLALHAAGFADHVVAVERSPSAAWLAHLNICLNALSHRIEVRVGDLYRPVAGERFDTVVANPPMLPVPADIRAPLLGDAGEDGLAVTRRLLAGLPEALHPDGTAQMIGVALGDGVEGIGLRSLSDAIGDRLDLTVSIIAGRALTSDPAYLDAIVAATGAVEGQEAREVRDAYLAMVARTGTDTVCNLFIQARHGHGHIERIDVSAANRASGWCWQW